MPDQGRFPSFRFPHTQIHTYTLEGTCNWRIFVRDNVCGSRSSSRSGGGSKSNPAEFLSRDDEKREEDLPLMWVCVCVSVSGRVCLCVVHMSGKDSGDKEGKAWEGIWRKISHCFQALDREIRAWLIYMCRIAPLLLHNSTAEGKIFFNIGTREEGEESELCIDESSWLEYEHYHRAPCVYVCASLLQEQPKRLHLAAHTSFSPSSVHKFPCKLGESTMIHRTRTTATTISSSNKKKKKLAKSKD